MRTTLLQTDMTHQKFKILPGITYRMPSGNVFPVVGIIYMKNLALPLVLRGKGKTGIEVL